MTISAGLGLSKLEARGGIVGGYVELHQLHSLCKIFYKLSKSCLIRVPTASYKSYNLTQCPIFVLYLDDEGICPILFLKMSYKSYNLGVLSYNYFQIHVQPAYRQVQAKMFAATRQTHIINHDI